MDLEPPFLIVKPGLSEDDFYRLAGEDSDWEYLDGRIVKHSPASRRHEDLVGFLLTLVRGFLDETGLGVVLGSHYPMRLDRDWSPEPDLLVVRTDRRSLVGQQRLEGPADLVIEIASESDPRLDVREKLPRYRAAGIPEIWLVDPFESRVLVERLGERGHESRTISSGRLESSVLPGFWIEVSCLWQDVLPSTVRCLRDMLE